MRVIAIDGPAGAGKSTIARAVAAHLGLAYLDTGAMYRAVTLAALQRGIDPADRPAVAALARQLAIDVSELVTIDGTDATDAIRGPAVTAAVSTVAAHPEVRAELVRRQREWADDHGGGVVEGRDIGTVVLPAAEVKVFLTASGPARARRRAGERAGGDPAVVQDHLARRDALDSSRADSPLAVAPGAVVIDTSELSIEEVVGAVLACLPRRRP